MTGNLTDIIQQVLERAPQWVRQGLNAKDPKDRARAEEVLAAMIAAALDGQAGADV